MIDTGAHLQKAADYLVQATRQTFIELMAEQDSGTRSPLEEVFRVWFAAHVGAVECVEPFADALILQPQKRVVVNGKTYSLDFSVECSSPIMHAETQRLSLAATRIAVEIDDHGSHDTTRTQNERRNKRDRDLQSHGWRIFHFSETELLNDPLKCVIEVIEHASSAYQRLWSQICDLKDREGLHAGNSQGHAENLADHRTLSGGGPADAGA